MYHRIAEERIDPWRLCVSPIHFEEQLSVLCRTRQPFPVTDFVNHLMAGTLPANAVCLTFDDGYVDNLVAGKPRLQAAGIPAMVFLCTGSLDQAGPFWWDELAHLIVRESGPRTFELLVSGQRKYFHFDPISSYDDKAKHAAEPEKQAALISIFQLLQKLRGEEREIVMDQLRSVLPAGRRCAAGGRPMTGAEVRTLTQDRLVTIGAHSVTHPLLSELDAVACQHEVVDSKSTCEALNGAPVVGFAYPYGDFDAKARKAVVSAGFTFACSTNTGAPVATSDVFALPRIRVCDWNGDAFEEAMRSVAARA